MKGRTMKTLKAISYLMILVLSISLVSAKSNYTAKQIIEKTIQTGRLSGSEAIATMIIYDNSGHKRIRKTKQVTKLFDKGNTEKKLIKFMAPADVKGTGFLTFDYKIKDDDMWLYMPALRKTRRIVSSEKAKSFMGSEFSYADMTPPNINDFKYKLLGEEKVDGTQCWKIEIIPINEDIEDENGFTKKIGFIGQKDFTLRKAMFYSTKYSIIK